MGLIVASSPCPLAPWQDLAHLGSLIGGALAFWALGRHAAPAPERDRWLPSTAVGLLVLHLVVGGVVFVVRT